MNVKRIIRRMTDNDYLFTIFTKIMAVFIGLIASFYSNRFLGPELKGQLGRISSMLSIVAVTANFGLYQPYPYYKRQGEADVLNKFLRIFLLQFIAYTVIGVVGAVCFHSFELTAVCLLAPIQVLANQLSFMMMVEDVKIKNAIFFTARITNTLITIIAFYTMDRTILVALALIVVGDVITVVMALMRMKRFPNLAEGRFEIRGENRSVRLCVDDYDADADAQLPRRYADDGLHVSYSRRRNRLLFAGRIAFRIRLADSGCLPRGAFLAHGQGRRD